MKRDEIIQYLKKVNNDILFITPLDYNSINQILQKLQMIIARIKGENSQYLNDINSVGFSFQPDLPYGNPKKEWENGIEELKGIIETIIEEYELFTKPGDPIEEENKKLKKNSSRIFIVHGHDGEMMQETARFIEKLGMQPIILKEQPNGGRTIIEKFEDYSDVDFAIVLFSPDDSGKAEQENEFHYRPRQNVVFELGFFIGRLGRQNVVVLHKVVYNFEMLTDFQGVLFVPYHDGWEFKIVKELKAVGFDVDLNRLP